MSKLPIEMLEPPKGQTFYEFESDMRRQIKETFFVPLEMQLDWRQRFVLAWLRYREAVIARIAALIER